MAIFDEEDDLFGISDIEEMGDPVESEKVKNKTLSEEAHDAWRKWMEFTDRPQTTQPDRRFISTFVTKRREGTSHGGMMVLVEGAASLQPTARDSTDVRRVLKAMKEKTQGALAKQAYKERLDKIISPLSDNYEQETLSTIREISEALNMEPNEWSTDEMESVSVIMSTIPSEDLKTAVKNTLALSGKEYVMPSDVVRWRRAWKNGQQIKAVANAKRDTYKSGSTERDKVADIDMESDFEAGRLHMMGADYETIREFHAQAPRKYWVEYAREFEAVMEEEPDLGIEETREIVEENLEPDFKWKPSYREIPQW